MRFGLGGALGQPLGNVRAKQGLATNPGQQTLAQQPFNQLAFGGGAPSGPSAALPAQQQLVSSAGPLVGTRPPVVGGGLNLLGGGNLNPALSAGGNNLGSTAAGGLNLPSSSLPSTGTSTVAPSGSLGGGGFMAGGLQLGAGAGLMPGGAGLSTGARGAAPGGLLGMSVGAAALPGATAGAKRNLVVRVGGYTINTLSRLL